MPLRIDLLENVSDKGDGKRTARCPACAAKGGDNKGEHLVIYPDGKFSCVAHANDHPHRQEIWKLVGSGKASGEQTDTAIIIPVNPFEIPPANVKLWSGRLGRKVQTSEEGSEPRREVLKS